jgi:hypothetical protein
MNALYSCLHPLLIGSAVGIVASTLFVVLIV